MPYDIRRLRGFAAALLAVVAGLACYGLALRATLGQTGPWITLRSQTFNVPIAPEGSIKRVLGIKRDLSSGVHVAHGERLGILVGASTLQLGVDPAILDAEVGKGYRWTSIYTVAHAHEIALVVRSMFQAGVVPKVMVLVGNPGILVADGDEQAEPGWYDPRPFLTSLKERKLKTAMGELVTLTMVPWNVAFPYRGRVFTLVDRWLFQTKFAMLQGLGQGLEALGAPEADPWLNRYPPADVIPKTELMNKYVLKYIGIKGWYNPSNYRVDGPNFAAVLDIFRTAHEAKAKTFFIFPPERSDFRARLPLSAADHLEHTLVKALGDAAPVIFDYREAIPDQEFTDVNHLGPSGREHLSHRLADELGRLLGGATDEKPRP